MRKDPLAREQEMVVQIACHAVTRTIEQYSPVGTDTLLIEALDDGDVPLLTPRETDVLAAIAERSPAGQALCRA
jgi:hypothetical protein